jgi:hypothetical protein
MHRRDLGEVAALEASVLGLARPTCLKQADDLGWTLSRSHIADEFGARVIGRSRSCPRHEAVRQQRFAEGVGRKRGASHGDQRDNEGQSANHDVRATHLMDSNPESAIRVRQLQIQPSTRPVLPFAGTCRGDLGPFPDCIPRPFCGSQYGPSYGRFSHSGLGSLPMTRSRIVGSSSTQGIGISNGPFPTRRRSSSVTRTVSNSSHWWRLAPEPDPTTRPT